MSLLPQWALLGAEKSVRQADQQDGAGLSAVQGEVHSGERRKALQVRMFLLSSDLVSVLRGETGEELSGSSYSLVPRIENRWDHFQFVQYSSASARLSGTAGQAQGLLRKVRQAASVGNHRQVLLRGKAIDEVYLLQRSLWPNQRGKLRIMHEAGHQTLRTRERIPGELSRNDLLQKRQRFHLRSQTVLRARTLLIKQHVPSLHQHEEEHQAIPSPDMKHLWLMHF